MLDWGRRRHYRVQINAADRIRVMLIEGDGADAPRRNLRVENTAAGGLLVGQPDSIEPAPELGDIVRVEISVSDEDFRHEAEMQVVRVEANPDKNETLFATCFVDSEAFYASMKDGAWQYFNRRAALRVEFPAEQPLNLWLGGGGLSTQSTAINASLLGVALELEPELAGRTPTGTEVRLELELEEHKALLTGTVRHTTPAGDKLRLGIAFDPQGDSRHERHAEALGAFLVARQTVAG